MKNNPLVPLSAEEVAALVQETAMNFRKFTVGMEERCRPLEGAVDKFLEFAMMPGFDADTMNAPREEGVSSVAELMRAQAGSRWRTRRSCAT